MILAADTQNKDVNTGTFNRNTLIRSITENDQVEKENPITKKRKFKENK